MDQSSVGSDVVLCADDAGSEEDERFIVVNDSIEISAERIRGNETDKEGRVRCSAM